MVLVAIISAVVAPLLFNVLIEEQPEATRRAINPHRTTFPLSVPRPEPEQASARRECLARMRLPKRLRPCEALPRLAPVMAGYLGRSPAAARYPPMAWIPIAAITPGSSRAPNAPPILVAPSSEEGR